VKDLADAVQFATMMGSKNVAEKKALAPGSFLVVKSATGVVEDVFVFVKGKHGPVHAKCSGPASELDRLVTMCSSLRAI